MAASSGREEKTSGKKGQWGREPRGPIHQVSIRCGHVEAHGVSADLARGGAIASGAENLICPLSEAVLTNRHHLSDV